jgi:regulator of sigma E protease
MQALLAKLQEMLGAFADYGVPFVVTLSIVVFVHEFGHYWVARRCGVKVISFSIGMGPEIFGRTDKSGTRWKFSLLPIGGYVQMFGDADPASATVDAEAKAMPEDERKVAFFAQNVYKRIAIIAAGPGANYLFALIVLFGMFSFFGVPYTPPILDSVTEGGAAFTAGLKPGDKVLSVDGVKINKFSELQHMTALNLGAPMQLSIARGTELLQIAITPKIVDVTDRLGNQVKMPRMGVTTTTRTESYEKIGPVQAVQESFDYVWGFTRDTMTVIGQMIMGTRSTEDLGGALRIAKISGDIVKTRDVGWYIEFIVKISISLGFINLLPIPLLDGGHIFFYLLEAVRRKPVHERVQEYAARLGLGIVLCMMIFTLWNDLHFLKWWPV